MIRDYESGISDDPDWFVGDEVEHTALYGKKTLFVVKNLNHKEIVDLAVSNYCSNIYLGANKSFVKKPDWNLVMLVTKKALIKNIDVTVDFPYIMWEEACLHLVNYDNLHLNISFELPNIHKFANINVKVDDVDFNYSKYIF